jgi:hypothetical protein
MNYIKRRFSSGDIQNEITSSTLSISPINIKTRQSASESKFISALPTRSLSHANQQTAIGLSPSQEKFKLLLIIDDQHIDW